MDSRQGEEAFKEAQRHAAYAEVALENDHQAAAVFAAVAEAHSRLALAAAIGPAYWRSRVIEWRVFAAHLSCSVTCRGRRGPPAGYD